jgi:hypothetical protein
MTDRFAAKGLTVHDYVHVFPTPGATSPYVGQIKVVLHDRAVIKWTSSDHFDTLSKTSPLWSRIEKGQR